MSELPTATEKGFEAARELSKTFADELLSEAGRIARRLESEHASADHVRRAASNLYQGGTSRFQEALTAAGGAVLGAGASAFVSYAVDDTPNGWAITISAFLTLVGAVLMTYGLVRR